MATMMTKPSPMKKNSIGRIAVWDNRAVQHYAVPDYDTRRMMQRVVLAGDRPVGPR